MVLLSTCSHIRFCVKWTTKLGGVRAVAAHLTAIQSALKMLSGRIGILHRHIQNMQDGSVRPPSACLVQLWQKLLLKMLAHLARM